MKEVWRDIEGFENKYQISNTGKIKSLNFNNTKKSKILIPKVKKNNGLLEVTLNKNNVHHYFMLNRLVIKTFTDIKLNKNDVVMYKDKDKTNCSLDNLFIISRGKRQEITYDLDKRDRIKCEYYGKVLPLKEISKLNNNMITPRQIKQRFRIHWNIYESAEIPVAIFKRSKNGRNLERY